MPIASPTALLRAARAPYVACTALLLWVGACQPVALPGDPVGTYDITGTLTDNSCGAQALPAESPLTFEVQLRDNGGIGLWLIDGQAPGFSGSLSPSGAFLFSRSTSYVSIEPGSVSAPNTGEPSLAGLPDFLVIDRQPVPQQGCVLSIVEVIDGRLEGRLEGTDQALDAGVGLEPGTLTAESTIEVGPQAGSDCTAILNSRGGPFRELPCSASYTLEGERVP